jgi:hypothetical protein
MKRLAFLASLLLLVGCEVRLQVESKPKDPFIIGPGYNPECEKTDYAPTRAYKRGERVAYDNCQLDGDMWFISLQDDNKGHRLWDKAWWEMGCGICGIPGPVGATGGKQ